MTPSLHVLDGPGPLAGLVAERLLAGLEGFPLDLSQTQVWIPTAGAERRIRRSLADLAAQRQTGLLAPRFLQSSLAMIPDGTPLASRVEREAAWAQILEGTDAENLDALIPRSEELRGPRAWLGVGALLSDLCDLLAEGGWDPFAAQIAEICEEDGARWDQIKPLYRKYLSALDRAGRIDPNALRLQEVRQPTVPPGLRKVVVACIPDLSGLACRYADALCAQGITCEILVAGPGEEEATFDRWGRPVPEDWENVWLPIEPEQIVVARETADEADYAVEFLAAAQPAGDYAAVLVDPARTATLSAAVLRAGGRPFLPEGQPLAESEAAVVALTWQEWLSRRDLRALRRLLQCPHLLQWLSKVTALSPAELLTAADFLISDSLAETFDQAQSALSAAAEGPESTKPSPARNAAVGLMAALIPLNDLPSEDVVQRIWSEFAEGAEAAGQVLEVWQTIVDSPLFKNWPEGRGPAFVRALAAARLFETSEEGVVELSGWLEAPWLEAERLVVCGCAEGSLPSSVNEHAFLPDSRRKALGLPDNQRRLARDAYLLSVLLNRRSAENLHFSFSRFGPDGSPAFPSRLLLRCTSEALPARILQVFGKGRSDSRRPERKNAWRWNLPTELRKPAVTSLSPTGFKEYLACPFRFYLKRVLRADAFEPDAREMDALRFGTLVHAAVEAFALTARDEGRAEKIAASTLERLEYEARRMFGTHPAPAVRVQLEAVKVRLRAFARVQAEEFAKGWRILEVERQIKADDALMIGPLALSAKIDRIERHPDWGLRIMDYKTYAARKTPAETHLGSATDDPFVPEAAIGVGGKSRIWTDLQLPVYRFIAENLYPGEPVQTAYFGLTADPESSEVIPFEELSDDLYASALECARAVAERVKRGVFWPPQEQNASWTDPFAPWFLNGRPEVCFDPETIRFLEGQS